MKTGWIFRIVILSLLLTALAKPTVVRPDPGAPLKWAGFIDVSRSMAVKDPVERLTAVRERLDPLRSKLKHVDWYLFSDGVSPLEKDGLSDLRPEGKKSNLSKPLTDTLSGDEYRGGIIFSDGRQVGAGDVITESASLGKPLLLVGVGDKSFFKDVSVKSVQSPPFAFKNIETSLTAVISVVGYPGKKVNVKLKRGGRVLSVQSVEVAGPDAEVQVNFRWTPDTLGTKNFRVEVDAFTGEFTTKNNFHDFRLDVGRDRFRVLYICGKPGPEYGFLRHQFKADPAVELVTFVILRNASNIVNVPDAELSLIPFPTQDVLIAQMASFDLIVFEEFSYQQFGLPPLVMEAIRKKVESGGSFLIMGGDEMLGPGTAYNTPSISPMIPVEFGDASVKTVEGKFDVKFHGWNHPILQIASTKDRNQSLLNALPPLEEATLLPKAKKGATVLASLLVQGKEHPLLTVWKFGKGRIGVLATRNTWRISMETTPDFNGPLVYQTFWKNMVLWLTHNDEFKSVRVGLENQAPAAGEEAIVRVWVYDEYFQPVSDAEARLLVQGPDGSSIDVSVIPETKGVYAGRFTPEKPGRYTVKGWAFRGGKKAGEDALSFVASEGFFEEKNLKADWDLLRSMARASGGRFLSLSEFNENSWAEFDQAAADSVGRKVLVWNSPYLFGLLLFLLIGEWIWRKWRGLP